MSGHSKWSTIKNKKAKTDAVRGKIFTKLGRDIVIAVKEGGADPDNNSKLRDVIAKAKANNMPNDNIARSIKKAAGESSNSNYEEITYEGYGTNGVAIIVETVTDNKNRTASEIRHIFDKYGNGMGTTGCVGWMFDKKGIIVIERTDAIDEDELMELALDNGAQDFETLDDAFEIYTLPQDYFAARDALEAKGYEFINAGVELIPQNTVNVEGETAEKIIKLIDFFEDNDDVRNVYHNAIIDED